MTATSVTPENHSANDNTGQDWWHENDWGQSTADLLNMSSGVWRAVCVLFRPAVSRHFHWIEALAQWQGTCLATVRLPVQSPLLLA